MGTKLIIGNYVHNLPSEHYSYYTSIFALNEHDMLFNFGENAFECRLQQYLETVWSMLSMFTGQRVIAFTGDQGNSYTVFQLLIYCVFGILVGVVGGLLGLRGGFVMSPLFQELGVPP